MKYSLPTLWQLLQTTVKQGESELTLQMTFCLKGVRTLTCFMLMPGFLASCLRSVFTLHRAKTRVPTLLEVHVVQYKPC